MPDWVREALRRLAGSKFSAEERGKVSRELAGYLEDLYDASCANGQNESDTIQNALDELHRDARLGPKLYRARKENSMNDRTKQFWLPGTATMLASALCLAVLEFAQLRAHFTPVWLRHGATSPHSFDLPLVLNWPWLGVLPFLGAAGAYLSRRAGGRRAVQAAAGFFSAFVFLASLLIVLVLSFVSGDLLGGVPATRTLFPEFVGAIVSWVLIPGVALLLGVVPFLRNSNARHIV